MEDVVVHWPFVAAALIFASIGQFMKATVFTTDNILKYKALRPWFGELLWWGCKSLPLHPVLAGVALSFVPGIPAPEMLKTQAATTLYFAAAGLASTWAFAVVKGLAKKNDFDLEGT